MLNRIIIVILFFCSVGWATDSKLKAMGNISMALPNIDAQVNLFQLAGNTAGLILNDSTNWVCIEVGSFNHKGTNRRYWDPKRVEYNFISYKGQKQLHNNMIFYGDIQYIWDNRYGMQKAIERTPYAMDPFVLADSTSGNILFSGPDVSLSLNHRITKDFHWGAAMDYSINNGLKNLYTRPEIITTDINFSIDLLYQLNRFYSLGISFSPYYQKDYTKLVNQPNKSQPISFRYRGEFEFRKHVGISDREAIYKGYKLLFPQVALKSSKWEGVIFSGYSYHWHELFDKVSNSIFYDGYYQGQHYFGRLALRHYLSERKGTTITLDYQYRYIEDWAREPNYNLMIYQSYRRIHLLLAGLSCRIRRKLELAVEGTFLNEDPDRRDYLAKVYRRGDITKYILRGGINYILNQSFQIRLGLEYQWFREGAVWDYYGNHEGPLLTSGIGYNWPKFELNGYVRFGKLVRDELVLYTEHNRYKEVLDASIQIKSYF